MIESEFIDKLSGLLNSVSAENGSDTPDFILAEYLTNCLKSFDLAVKRREYWYGRKCSNGVTILVKDEVS